VRESQSIRTILVDFNLFQSPMVLWLSSFAASQRLGVRTYFLTVVDLIQYNFTLLVITDITNDN
jgi:hypothetical protein